jgi:hypothetical protein
MNRKIALAVIVTAAAAGYVGYVQKVLGPTTARTPEQNKALYELQEKCAKDAANLVDRAKADKLYGANMGVDTFQKQSVDELQIHYSARFNKCFAELQDTVTDNLSPVNQQLLSVWDVNERRMIGRLIVFNTHVSDCFVINLDYPDEDDRNHFGKCQDLPKWNALIKPYMHIDHPATPLGRGHTNRAAPLEKYSPKKIESTWNREIDVPLSTQRPRYPRKRTSLNAWDVRFVPKADIQPRMSCDLLATQTRECLPSCDRRRVPLSCERLRSGRIKAHR